MSTFELPAAGRRVVASAKQLGVAVSKLAGGVVIFGYSASYNSLRDAPLWKIIGSLQGGHELETGRFLVVLAAAGGGALFGAGYRAFGEWFDSLPLPWRSRRGGRIDQRDDLIAWQQGEIARLDNIGAALYGEVQQKTQEAEACAAELIDARALVTLLQIPTVGKAARRAVRQATHPDQAKTEAEKPERTKKFQEAEALLDKLEVG